MAKFNYVQVKPTGVQVVHEDQNDSKNLKSVLEKVRAVRDSWYDKTFDGKDVTVNMPVYGSNVSNSPSRWEDIWARAEARKILKYSEVSNVGIQQAGDEWAAYFEETMNQLVRNPNYSAPQPSKSTSNKPEAFPGIVRQNQFDHGSSESAKPNSAPQPSKSTSNKPGAFRGIVHQNQFDQGSSESAKPRQDPEKSFINKVTCYKSARENNTNEFNGLSFFQPDYKCKAVKLAAADFLLKRKNFNGSDYSDTRVNQANIKKALQQGRLGELAKEYGIDLEKETSNLQL